MTFGDRLRGLRQACSLTQVELASKCAIPLGTLRDYEQGRRVPLFDNVIKLAKALNTTCDAFAECTFDRSTGETDSASE